MILDDDELRLTYFQRLEIVTWFAAHEHGLLRKAPWLKGLMLLVFNVLTGAEVFAMRSKIMFYRFINAIIYAVAVVLGTLIGYYQLITRYYLGEFLIIWAVVGWSLFSLIRGFELRDPAVVFRVAEYLS